MGKIMVVGHGYEAGQLTLQAVECLQSGARVILHTGRCECAHWLNQAQIPFETLDALYESCEDFDEHARQAADAVCAAAENEDVVFGVFDVRDRSVSVLMNLRKDVRVIAGPLAEGALFAHLQGATELLEASDWERYQLSSAKNALIRELDSRELASEVKLKLMEIYPDETAVFVRFGDGAIAHTQLYNLDRLKYYDHRTCALVTAEPELRHLERFDFARLEEIIRVLLGPNGCPWDRAQTHASLRPYIIEEAYEVVGAIDEQDPYHLYDELGDMLLQVMLHAEIARKHGEFDIVDIISAISEKMISRHSHVFGSDCAENSQAVTDLWNKNKMAERGQTTYAQTLKEVSKSLPSALRASKLLKRIDAACRTEQTLDDALETAVKRAGAIGNAEDAESAIGEAMLALVAVARAAKVDPEIALNAASDHMVKRFEDMEARATVQSGSLDGVPEAELREYWNLVKLLSTGKSGKEFA